MKFAAKPTLAILRPDETLAAYEMNYVSLLADEFVLRIVTAGNSALGGRPEGAQRLKWPDEFGWKGRRRSFLNGIYARVFKRRYHIPGIARSLEGVDIVQAGEAASEYTYQAARLKDTMGFRLLLSASENQDILGKRTKSHAERIRYSLSKADHAFAIPDDARLRLIEAGYPENQITVIGHGIDCERFSPADHVVADRFRVGYCGRFRKEKGLEHLLAATSDLDVDLTLLGDGPDKSALRKIAGGNVTFPPALPYPEMHTFYKSIDLFVLPSIPLPGLVEQFGFVLMEALASGVPIVASNIGGIPAVVGANGDCAVLVPPADVAALRNAIENLKNDPGRRSKMARAGRDRAEKLYRRELVADRMREVYRVVLS